MRDALGNAVLNENVKLMHNLHENVSAREAGATNVVALSGWHEYVRYVVENCPPMSGHALENVMDTGSTSISKIVVPKDNDITTPSVV